MFVSRARAAPAAWLAAWAMRFDEGRVAARQQHLDRGHHIHEFRARAAHGLTVPRLPVPELGWQLMRLRVRAAPRLDESSQPQHPQDPRPQLRVLLIELAALCVHYPHTCEGKPITTSLSNAGGGDG